MESTGIFGGTLSLLEKVLDLRSLKHNFLVSNIANMDTPNYKPFDLVIEEEIKKAMWEKDRIDLKKSHSGHFPLRETPFWITSPVLAACIPIITIAISSIRNGMIMSFL